MLGCLFQLNVSLSLSGHYGKGVTELAQYLLKNNYYSLVGTDPAPCGSFGGIA